MTPSSSEDPARPQPGDPTTLHARRAVDGDAESLSWLVDRFAPALLAQARYRLGRLAGRIYDPEDLVQDAWAVALPRLPDLPSRDGRTTPVLMKFLSTALRNRSNALYRRHLSGKPLREDAPHSSLAADVTGVMTQAMRSEASDQLRTRLEGLSEQDREIIVLRGIEQNRNETVARLLGLPPNTVAVRYRRALARLREKLPGTVFDDLVA